MVSPGTAIGTITDTLSGNSDEAIASEESYRQMADGMVHNIFINTEQMQSDVEPPLADMPTSLVYQPRPMLTASIWNTSASVSATGRDQFFKPGSPLRPSSTAKNADDILHFRGSLKNPILNELLNCSESFIGYLSCKYIN